MKKNKNKILEWDGGNETYETMPISLRISPHEKKQAEKKCQKKIGDELPNVARIFHFRGETRG